ncbi:MAG: nitronate monooxygenase [Sphingomonadales bacterium]|jgi:nitronate monooxygenase|nr:nitronate monooxygenase [Sphingomonadales bacterium]
MKFAASLGIDHPILKAPLAGAGDTPELVAAVSEAGGLGILGAAYLQPDSIRAAARRIRELTSRPFGLNLFAPIPPAPLPADAGPALRRLAPWFEELALPAPDELPAEPHPDFGEQLQAVLDSMPAVFSFAFGETPPEAVAALKGRGIFLIGTATTVEEAVGLRRSGVDAVVAQGSEAGGHRGTYATGFEAGMVGTMALVPQMADAIDAPVIASGGIMDGRGIAAALALGAAAVQLGTAFLTCPEAGTPPPYRRALLDAAEDSTRITAAFSGRPARGIDNPFLREMAEAEILPFPWQNALTRPLRTKAAELGRADLLSLWAGQGLRLARELPAAELVRVLLAETEAALARTEARL